jgi:DNA-binding CsgD family transcriptional regulator
MLSPIYHLPGTDLENKPSSAKENQELLLALLQRIAASKASARRWDYQSLFMSTTILAMVLILQWQRVDDRVVSMVALVGLLIFGMTSVVRGAIKQKQIYRQEMESFGKILDANSGTVYDNSPANTSGLSNREMKVLILIARGYSNKAVGCSLGITESTARNHVTSILRKLHAENRLMAAMIALKKGWIDLDIPANSGSGKA